MSEKRFLEYESLKDAMWKNFYREEDKWESMPEADFLDVHGGCPRHWFQLGFSAGLDAVVKAEPVPHEMKRDREKAKNIGTDYGEQDQFICSECGIHLQDWVRIDEDDYEDKIVHEYVFRFCPNCGRRIDDERE